MRWYRILLLLLLPCCLLAAACTDDGEDEEEKGDNSVKINLRVDQDHVFGFVQSAVIGRARFSNTNGIVGSRVQCRVSLNDYDRFQDKDLFGTFELINPDAIKDDSYLVEFDADEKETDFEFYIPQINSVPIFLNFQLTLYYEEEDLQGNLDRFEASLVYEFDVNQGRPAT
ncbi:MAG: hypothetical protein P9L99_15260 [Candidatus Lernaella stagnicola]|nr:hypothetical protein [Candidatus Lernaella stagnicola]